MLDCPLCKKELLDFHATFRTSVAENQKKMNQHLLTAFDNAYSVRLENGINFELDMDFFSTSYSQMRTPLESVIIDHPFQPPDSPIGLLIENPNPIHIQRAHAQYQLLLNRRRLQEVEEFEQQERRSLHIHKKDFCCIS
jgi:hypothetical protein